MDEKRCTYCEVVKPLAAFSPKAWACRECLAAYRRGTCAGSPRRVEQAALEAMGKKRCTACNAVKDLDAFTRRYDGVTAKVRSRCKACHYHTTRSRYGDQLRQAQDAWRERNRARVNAQARARHEMAYPRRKAAYDKWATKNKVRLAEASRGRGGLKKRATPVWADRDMMRDIYEVARMLTAMTGVPHQVDHMVPIKSDRVCGLHVPANLMIVTKTENVRKKNYFWQGM